MSLTSGSAGAFICPCPAASEAHALNRWSCTGAKAIVYPPIVPVSSNQPKSITHREKDQRTVHSALNGAEAVMQEALKAFKRIKKKK